MGGIRFEWRGAGGGSRPRRRLEPDSPLEQAGFELMVPWSYVLPERDAERINCCLAMAMVGASRGSMSAPFMVGP
jgi:hypothetical protein